MTQAIEGAKSEIKGYWQNKLAAEKEVKSEQSQQVAIN